MALDGMIFDLDGTLVDTNDVHVRAWAEVFAARGYRVADDRIFEEVGKGGDQLIPAVLGRAAATRDGPALRAAHPGAFERIARRQGLRAFAGAVELLAACRRRGLRVALATSSGGDHLRVISETSAVDWAGQVDQVVTSDDADASKPRPDLVVAAAGKLSLHPAQCAMLGDTPFDATAAKHAGVVCLAVRCGGNDDARLYEAGARRVYGGPDEILRHLDDALHQASPARLRLTESTLEQMMTQALAAAESALQRNDAPIGAALFDGDGRLLAAGHNEMASTQVKTAHAEMVTFARAAGKAALEARDLILASTLEPCVMCTGAAMESAVDTIVYGLKAPADAGTSRVKPPASPESQMPRIVGGILPAASRKLLETWLQRNAGTPQAGYVKQLLAAT